MYNVMFYLLFYIQVTLNSCTRVDYLRRRIILIYRKGMYIQLRSTLYINSIAKCNT